MKGDEKETRVKEVDWALTELCSVILQTNRALRLCLVVCGSTVAQALNAFDFVLPLSPLIRSLPTLRLAW